MATSEAIEVRKKLKLERELSVKLREFFKSQTKDFYRNQLGEPSVEASVWRARMQDIIGATHLKTIASFSGVVESDLPDNLKLTDEERTALDNYLTSYFSSIALINSQYIEETTEKNRRLSRDMAIEAAKEDEQQSNAAFIAVTAAAIFSRKQRSRIGLISNSEVQLASETTKRAEMGMLIGRRDDPLSITREDTGVVKRWNTMGDEVVRPDHHNADGQEVPENEPFVVGGQTLMFPRDTQHGATLDNVINCRCWASYHDIEEIRNRVLRDVEIIAEGPLIDAGEGLQ